MLVFTPARRARLLRDAFLLLLWMSSILAMSLPASAAQRSPRF